MSTTPNMNITLPTVSVTEGPEYAAQQNAAFEIVDDHDHTSSKGKKIPTQGIDINQNLSFNSYSADTVKSIKFDDQDTTLTGASNAGSVFEKDGDLYYTNSGGVAVQITDGNDIVSNVVIPSSPLMPSGTVLDFAGSSAPVGFLEANGAVVSQATYVDLFAAIGSSYNTGGEGAGNFRLPDLSGRVVVGRGSYTDSVLGSVTRTIAQLIGAAAHIITTGEMPSHTHTQNSHTHLQGYGGTTSPGPRYGTVSGLPTVRTDFEASSVTNSDIGIEVSTVTATNQNTGGGGSHNNMQPSIVMMKIIKT